VRGGGGADVAKEIGAGRCHRNSAPANQLQRHRMRRHAHATRGRPAVTVIGHGGGTRQQKRQRPRPEGRYQLTRRLGKLHGTRPSSIVSSASAQSPGPMPDVALAAKIAAQPPSRVQRISRRGTVVRFGGKRHEPAGAQNLPRPAPESSRLGRFPWLCRVDTNPSDLHNFIIVACCGPKRRHLPYTHLLTMPSRPRSKSAWRTLADLTSPP